ncbi:MAG: alcohol dehydrogenase catalytic domain-containing protein [Clostridiales bacterium]|nr:alcohol dehydrogenase catalytic domain-containing protein [Clostridiales bacterium]
MNNIPDTMMAVVARGMGDYRLERVPVPRPGPGELLMKVETCGLCAGDIKATHGTARFWGGDGMPGYCEPPFTPGHEFIGRIAARGEGAPEEFPVGARVASEQIVPCGKCLYCKDGRYWLCDPHNVYGFKYSLNGGMAEYAILPANSRNYLVPEQLPAEQAVLIEPYACSLHAVRRAGITVDDAVVLAGCGTLGLGMAGAIRRRNPRLFIALDTRDDRLELAAAFGADLTINPLRGDAIARVMEQTGGYGCDVYIEATGNPAAVNQGLEMIKKGGTFVEFSVFSGPTTADWSIIGDTKEITIVGSQLSPYCFPAAIEGIVSGQLPTAGVVTHWFPIERFAEAFEAAQAPGAIKVALRMG